MIIGLNVITFVCIIDFQLLAIDSPFLLFCKYVRAKLVTRI